MEEQKITNLSWVSLITSIVGFFVFGLILGIVAIVTGAMSWEKGLGKVGFVIGIIDVVGLLILF